MQDSTSSTTQLSDLDNASLTAVLGWLSAKELAAVAGVCSTLRAAARSNLLWLQLLSADFGLLLSSTPAAGAAAGRALYLRLLQGSRSSSSAARAIPCSAVCTDGGCDETEATTYWADNLFRYSVSDLYCSDAGTRNVHVFGRLLPDPDAPGTRREGVLTELQQSAEALRGFILERCTCTARELVAPAVLEAAVAARDGTAAGAGGGGEEGASGSGAGSSSSSGSIGGVLQVLTGYGRREWLAANKRKLLEQRQQAAAAALESCSTRGLCDFFAESYNARQSGDPWADGLFKGLRTDADIHKMHMLMFALWSEQVQGRNRRLSLQRCSLPQPPPAPPAAPAPAAAAGSGTTQQQQQQQRRQPTELLCDADQLRLLSPQWGGPSLAQSSCLIQEVYVSRGKHATCPITSGIVYLGCQQQQQQTAPTAAPAAAQRDEQAGAGVGAVLGQLLQQPWVTAGSALSSAAAVFAAAESGLLPRVLDYAAGASAEWIEFQRPTQQEGARQQQQQALGDSASSSSGGVDSGSSGGLSGVLLYPALWFRFKTGLVQHTLEDEDEDDEGMGGLQDQEESGSSGSGEGEEGEQAGAAAAAAAAAGTESGGDVEVQPEQQQQQPEQQQEAEGVAGAAGGVPDQAGSSGAAADGAVAQPEAAAASGPDGDGGSAAEAAAAAVPQPRQVAPFPVCDRCPQLPAVAPEVAAALGWQPGPQQLMSLSVRLQQPRLAQLLCVKLIDSEDCSPDFNESRGGCNIDCEMVMVRGQGLLPDWLPVGLQLVGLAARME